uniref:T-cell receptor alpha/delta variable 10.0.4 n=1 Tax=Sinocyclocheilus grahami TaxID=75366 RepID=A0A672N5I2_SINGR
MLLCCLLVFLFYADTFAQSIRPLQNDIHVTEKKPVMLSCKYEGSANSLHWYRQYPGSKPEFEKNRVALKISSASVSDSALYYCALQPTVTGNASTLYKMGKTTKRKTQQIL